MVWIQNEASVMVRVRVNFLKWLLTARAEVKVQKAIMECIHRRLGLMYAWFPEGCIVFTVNACTKTHRNRTQFSPEICTKSLSFNTSFMASFSSSFPPLWAKLASKVWVEFKCDFTSERRIVSSISHWIESSPFPHGTTNHLPLNRTDNRILCYLALPVNVDHKSCSKRPD